MSATRTHLAGDELIATRSVTAPIDVVWRAFTTPAHLAAFWGGDHARVPEESVSVDLRVGGTFELETRSLDDRFSSRLSFIYQKIVEPELLVLLEPDTGLETTIRLRRTGAGTSITVHQRRLPPQLRTDQARRGLAGVLDALSDLLVSTCHQ